jgi:hypothetical protein
MTALRRNIRPDARLHAETDLHLSTIVSTDDDRDIRGNAAGDSLGRIDLVAHSVLISTRQSLNK